MQPDASRALSSHARRLPGAGAAAGPDRKHKVLDFFLPMQTRKWLMLLNNDPVSGIRVRPNLDLPAEELGFSFASNEFGLRGPANVQAPNVVFGSSFAMGFAVDNGLNWHELSLDPKKWFNAGLPVGVLQMEALFNQLHHGPRETALILYHPNLWTFTKQYDGLAGSGQSAFSFFRWQMERKACFQMQLKVMARRAERIKSGTALSFKHNGMRYYVDSKVCLFDFNADWDIFMRGILAWKRMLNGFKRVVFSRIPMKQELCVGPRLHESFRNSRKNYDFGWLMTKEFLEDQPGIEFHEPAIFEMGDYHALDGHWNESGNQRYAGWLSSLLGLQGANQRPRLVAMSQSTH